MIFYSIKKHRGLPCLSKFVQYLVFTLLFKGCILNYTYNINQQTFYFKIEPFTVHYLYALLLYLLLFTPDISVLGLQYSDMFLSKPRSIINIEIEIVFIIL